MAAVFKHRSEARNMTEGARRANSSFLNSEIADSKSENDESGVRKGIENPMLGQM